MARKKDSGWVVRVTLVRNGEQRDRAFQNANVSVLVTEIFRYAGLVSVVSESPTETVFDISPDDKRTQYWADSNTARIKSFGIQAQAIQKY